MRKKPRLLTTKGPSRRDYNKASRHEELILIVGQLIFTTLALSMIALIAAILHIDSRDFWEVIRGAIGLQGILQGTRMLIAVSK